MLYINVGITGWLKVPQLANINEVGIFLASRQNVFCCGLLAALLLYTHYRVTCNAFGSSGRTFSLISFQNETSTFWRETSHLFKRMLILNFSGVTWTTIRPE